MTTSRIKAAIAALVACQIALGANAAGADAPLDVQKYINDERDGLSSRLLMYWNTKATDVFINGEFYSHAGG